MVMKEVKMIEVVVVMMIEMEVVMILIEVR